jgi:MoaA/NifB/PqqE/SkfB family radical SAM enzyme
MTFKKITSAWPHQDQIKVEWNLGKRCNYDCSYCPSSIHDSYSPHTPIDILEKTVDRLCELGKPLRISLTGGEPCVHPDIEDLFEYMKRKGIFWVNVTTNGTRNHKWYSDNSEFFQHLVFSLHFEHDWQRVLSTIHELYFTATHVDFFVNVMAHHDHMDDVRAAVDFLTRINVKFAVRRIRWTEGDHNVFDDMRYDGKDLQWILDNDATAKPNVRVDDEHIIHANDIIKKHQNQFKGWTCNAGLESLMINWDGEVHRATCRVGGSLGNIYNNTFVVPTTAIECTRDFCTCAADIPLTKIKDD